MSLEVLFRAALSAWLSLFWCKSIVVGTPLQFVSEHLTYLLGCFNDLRALSLHFFRVQLTDVIQIDVH